jgi:hypothetical protein
MVRGEVTVSDESGKEEVVANLEVLCRHVSNEAPQCFSSVPRGGSVVKFCVFFAIHCEFRLYYKWQEVQTIVTAVDNKKNYTE